MIVLEVKLDHAAIPLLKISFEFPMESKGPQQEPQLFYNLTPACLDNLTWRKPLFCSSDYRDSGLLSTSCQAGPLYLLFLLFPPCMAYSSSPFRTTLQTDVLTCWPWLNHKRQIWVYTGKNCISAWLKLSSSQLTTGRDSCQSTTLFLFGNRNPKFWLVLG